MSKRNWILVILVGLVLVAGISFGLSFRKHSISLRSPSKKVSVHLSLEKVLNYSLYKDKELLVASSPLGINIDSRTYGNVKSMKVVNTTNIDRTIFLKERKSSSHLSANKYRIAIQDENGYKWFLEAIVSDKGFAFRYDIPGEGSRHIDSENTSFKIPRNAKVWFAERENRWKLATTAGYWKSGLIEDMESISKMGTVQASPLIVELQNSYYLTLAEAGCYDYSGMRYDYVGENTFKAEFEEEKGFDVNGSVLTPWRSILISDNLNELVNNTFIADIAPQPDKELYTDQTYIKPGKSVWRWWARGTGSPEQEKGMVDKAASLYTEYSLIDAGWIDWPNKWEALEDICAYANSQSIGIWVWKHSAELKDAFYMNLWLDSVRNAGAVGIKVDHFNSTTLESNMLQTNIIRAAAKRKLMVNLHGVNAGSGEFVSFPNMMTREGVRGMELNGLGMKMQRAIEPAITASHNAALAFTRFVVGPADYTPLGLSAPGETTWAHQLATLVEFTSPFQAIVEDPDFLMEHPQAKICMPFIKRVPATWDETIVLSESKIGEFSAIARRSGNTWYIGGINGGEQKKYTLDFSFLKENELYKFTSFEDDVISPKVNLTHVLKRARYTGDTLAIPFKLTDKEVKSDQHIDIVVAKHGGFAGMLEPVN